MLINRAEDLVIYTIALDLSSEINELADDIPYNWNIKEVDQIKRSSSSIHSNITEGFAQRFYSRKFIHYLNIALGSSDETQNHIRKLKNDCHINIENANHYLKKYK
ncbi:four helix bundle protein, partial [candidate division KSB1 bacterium]